MYRCDSSYFESINRGQINWRQTPEGKVTGVDTKTIWSILRTYYAFKQKFKSKYAKKCIIFMKKL